MASKISWFGGHMRKTLSQVEERLKLVDLVLEVRDARIPFTSANPQLNALTRHKRRLVILNKADLAAPDKQQAVRHHLQLSQQHVLFTSTHRGSSIQKLLDAVMTALRQAKPKADALIVMALGIPNCGKSSLINAICQAASSVQHKGKAPAVTGVTPGLTRQIAGFQIGERPTAYLMDTPGVMLPNVPDEQAGLRLALTGAIKDTIVSEERLVRQVLLELAQQPTFPEACLTADHKSRATGQKRHVQVLQQAVMAAVAAMRQSHKDSCEKAGDSNLNPLQATGETTEADGQSAQGGCAKHQTALPELDVDAGLAALQHALKGNALSPSMLTVMHSKLINAYRAGHLGRYTLDSLP